MRPWLRWLLGGLFLLALVVLLGPRATVEIRLSSASLPTTPQALEAYLRTKEARLLDLRKGVEKTVLWADPKTKAQTPYAILFLHGFSATRREISPFCEDLSKALHANVFFPRLRGHGRSDDAFGEAKAGDWIEDLHEALRIGKILGKKLILVGSSTGATLALWGLANLPRLGLQTSDIAASILLSTNFGPKDPKARLLLLPWGKLLARLILGPYRSWKPFNPQQAHFWTTRYPSGVLVEMMALVRLLETTDLSVIQTPVLMIYAPGDQVIDTALVEDRFPRLGSPKKRLLPLKKVDDPAQHILAGDILSPSSTSLLVQAALSFLGVPFSTSKPSTVP